MPFNPRGDELSIIGVDENVIEHNFFLEASVRTIEIYERYASMRAKRCVSAFRAAYRPLRSLFPCRESDLPWPKPFKGATLASKPPRIWRMSVNTVDVPNSPQTCAYDINNSGQIVGLFSDTSGTHGFLASPDDGLGEGGLLRAGTPMSPSRVHLVAHTSVG